MVLPGGDRATHTQRDEARLNKARLILLASVIEFNEKKTDLQCKAKVTLSLMHYLRLVLKH